MAQCTSLLADIRAKRLKRVIFGTESCHRNPPPKNVNSDYLEVLSQMLRHTSLLLASSRACLRCADNQFWKARMVNHLVEVWGKGLRPRLWKGSSLLPFFSVTSRPNSSPTEVATVPLAIKIMLGHARLLRASVVGNKRSGAGRNDANNWVVNLKQPLLWFRSFRSHLSARALPEHIKQRRSEKLPQLTLRL